jgi:hypothetical protein
MIEKRYWVALGAVSAALGACSGEVTTPPQGAGATGGTASAGAAGAPPLSGGSGGSAGSAGTAGSGVTGGSAGSSGSGGSPDVCVPGVPATSQIPRMKNQQYDNVVRDLLGVTTLPGAGGPPSSLLVADFDGSLTDIAWNAYQRAADTIATEVMAGANRPRFVTCELTAPTCLADTIRAFGRKAFRRPLTPAEVESFERLKDVTPAGTPEEIAEGVLFAMLASPSFIMVPELGQETELQAIKLTSHEVAARLAFFLWGSVPDDALNAAADQNALGTREQILAQAQRMIQDRVRTAPVVAAFHRVYADIRPGSHWATVVNHDPVRFPNYTPAAVEPMMAEMDAFFEEVAFTGGSFSDLLLSSVGFVNRDTAAIYGLDPAAYGTELTRVELPAADRPGFLTRVGFLSSYSAERTSSPILRGAFIARKVLGVVIEDPPPEAAEAELPPGDYESERQVVELLTAPGECAGCHAFTINPPGFVLERYDSVGGIQTVDPLGGAIDTTAEVVFSETNIKPITTPLELMTELAMGAEARRNYAQQWVTFATGRVPNENDACQVNDLSTKLSADGYTILNVLTDLTQADSFRLRTVGN